MGGVRGYCWHHCAPRSASSSVALLAGLRSQPLKKAGGGGKSAVSGTAFCQSWAVLGSGSCWPGGGPGGGA